MSVCEDAFATFDLIDAVAARGNPNSVSDAGVAAFCAYTAVHGAALNVRINLPGIENEDFKKEMTANVEKLTTEAEKRLQKVREQVDRVLAQS
jgi:glutamate formiminotransferase/formiminotetrahydrofolate cyclodeaminase